MTDFERLADAVRVALPYLAHDRACPRQAATNAVNLAISATPSRGVRPWRGMSSAAFNAALTHHHALVDQRIAERNATPCACHVGRLSDLVAFEAGRAAN